MRFNPPPGWPVSPGWEPDPGFVPDPSWPPAPPGWQFWIDDSPPATVQAPYQGMPADPGVPPAQGVPPYPGAPPPYPGPPQWQPGGPFGPPPNHTTRNVLIGLGVGVVLVVALVVGLVFAFGGDSSKPKSDEDQIRAVVAGIESAWNNTDYDAFMKHTCHEFATDPSNSETSFKHDRSQNGEATLKVTSVKVTGDKADVTVDRKYADQSKPRSVQLGFVKEDGEWKMCPK
jgi:hypothetical protein